MPFWRWPVPVAVVTSEKVPSPRLRKSRFGTTAAYEGAPVPT